MKFFSKTYFFMFICIVVVINGCTNIVIEEPESNIDQRYNEYVSDFIQAGFHPLNSKDSITNFISLESPEECKKFLKEWNNRQPIDFNFNTRSSRGQLYPLHKEHFGNGYIFSFEAYDLYVSFKSDLYISHAMNYDAVHIEPCGLQAPGEQDPKIMYRVSYDGKYNYIFIEVGYGIGVTVAGNKLVGYDFVMTYMCTIVDNEKVYIEVRKAS